MSNIHPAILYFKYSKIFLLHIIILSANHTCMLDYVFMHAPMKP